MMNQLRQNLLAKGKNASLLLSRADLRERLLYFLILLLLPTQLGKHFWPDYALVYGFRVDYLSPTLYLTDLLIFLLFLHHLFFSVRTSFMQSVTFLLPYCLLFVFLLLTLVNASSVPAGLYSLGKVAELLFFGWFTARYLKVPRYYHSVPLLFLLTVVGESVLALLQLGAKGYVGGVFYFFGERSITSLTPGAATAIINSEVFLRAYGTFSHPNVLGGFLLLSMIYLLLNRKVFAFWGGFVLLFAGILLGTSGLLLTLSRLPLFLWAVFLIAFFLNVTQQRLRSHTFGRPLPYRNFFVRGGGGGVVVILCALFLLPFLSPVIARFERSGLSEEAFVVRADLNRVAIDIISRDPVLGVGLGNFILASIHYKSSATPLYFAVQPVHNIFLLVFAETGILGLVLFLWLLVLALIKASMPARILLVLALLLGLFDHYLLTLQQGQLLFSFIIGYCYAGKPRTVNSKS